MFRPFRGFQLQVGGLAPDAARYAGFSGRTALWPRFSSRGGMAGLAGAMEVAGTDRQLTPHVSPGYGFTAIIVAFLGRLHPVGCLFAGVLMSMLYIGGELGAIAARAAARAHRGVPGPAAVPPARARHADQLSRALAPACAITARRWRHERDRARSSLRPSPRARRLRSPRLGLLINEKAGILNLGAEGMMLVPAVAGFAAGFHSGNAGSRSRPAQAPACPRRRFRRARDLAQHQPVRDRARAEPLRLRLLGLHRRRAMSARRSATARRSRCRGSRTSRSLGPALFKQHPLVYVAIALAAALAWFLYRSRRASCSARSASRPTRRMRSATRALDPPRRSGCGRRALRPRRRVPVARLYAAVGRRAWSPAAAGSRSR